MIKPIQPKPGTKRLNLAKFKLKPQVKTEFKLKLLNCFQSTTSHGLPNMFKTHSLTIRLLWIACTLVSTVLCSYMVISSVNEYFEYDVVTKIRVIDQVPLEFPTITICNLDPFQAEFGTEFLRNLTLEKHKFDLNSYSNASLPSFFSWIYNTKSEALRQASNPSFGDKNRKALGFNLEESLYYCAFNYINCSHLNFSWYYDYSFGNCYQFNSGFDSNGTSIPLMGVNRPGETGGLYLLFFLKSLDNPGSYEASKGLKIFVHNKSNPYLPNDGIEIKPSAKTNIGIKKTTTFKEPSPYSTCQGDDKAYSQDVCINQCKQKLTIQKCNCYDLKRPNDSSYPACLSQAQVKCLESLFYEIDRCYLECPNECCSTRFDFMFSNSKYPNGNLFKFEQYNPFFLNKNATLDDFIEKSLALHIYYPELKYTVISESPKESAISLLANIGGTLGLFLGKFMFLFFFRVILLKLNFFRYKYSELCGDI